MRSAKDWSYAFRVGKLVFEVSGKIVFHILQRRMNLFCHLAKSLGHVIFVYEKTIGIAARSFCRGDFAIVCVFDTRIAHFGASAGLCKAE